MSNGSKWMELAGLLAAEWRGEPIDPRRAQDLADTLLPQHPDMKNTLGHIHERMTRAAPH